MAVNLITDDIAFLAKKIQEDILPEYEPNSRILSEAKLAKRLNSTQNRVHRAIQHLTAEGLVYTKTGAGTYAGKQNDFVDNAESNLFHDSFCIPSSQSHLLYKKLRVSIPASGVQKVFWQKTINAFNDMNPFIQVIADFGNDKGLNADVFFTPVHSLGQNINTYKPLNPDMLKNFGFNEQELCPEICNLCKYKKELYGIPALRIKSATWVNQRILKHYGISTDQIKKPGDVFRIASLLEEKSNGRVIGTNYCGYHWHAGNYGFDIQRINGKLSLEWEKLMKFLREARVCFGRESLKSTFQSAVNAFNNEEMGILPYYLYNYPILKKKKNFMLIPYPLEKNGFTAEGMSVGCISKECSNTEEASMLLAFIASRKTQELLAQETPWCFSVRNDVLKIQKETSPFPRDAVQYSFDLREYYSLHDDFIFHELGPAINTESGKYFLGLQSIETTIQKLKDLAG